MTKLVWSIVLFLPLLAVLITAGRGSAAPGAQAESKRRALVHMAGIFTGSIAWVLAAVLLLIPDAISQLIEVARWLGQLLLADTYVVVLVGASLLLIQDLVMITKALATKQATLGEMVRGVGRLTWRDILPW